MKQEAIPKVVEAIRHVLQGDIYASNVVKEKVFKRLMNPQGADSKSPLDILTNRELEVLRLIGEGCSTKEIADLIVANSGSNNVLIYPGLGNVMDFPGRELTGDAGPVKNPANTHIIEHAGRRLALWEGGLPTEVTPGLSTVGEYDFAGRLKDAPRGETSFKADFIAFSEFGMPA